MKRIPTILGTATLVGGIIALAVQGRTSPAPIAAAGRAERHWERALYINQSSLDLQGKWGSWQTCDGVAKTADHMVGENVLTVPAEAVANALKLGVPSVTV